MEEIVLNLWDWIALVLLIATGIWDLYFVFTKHATISQMYQKLYPKQVDLAIGVVGMILLCLAWFLHPVIRLIAAYFWGHVTFPNKETYNK